MATGITRHDNAVSGPMRERDALLTEVEVAERLKSKVGTLQVWRSTKRVALPYVKIGRLVRYRASAVEAFIAANEVRV